MASKPLPGTRADTDSDGPILIIERSATLRHAVQLMLQSKAGYSIDAVTNLAEGYSELRDHDAHKYAAIVIGFPAHDQGEGIELLKLLKRPRFRDVAVLLLAHSADPSLLDWVARRHRSALLLWDDYSDCPVCLHKLIRPGNHAPEFHPDSSDDIRILFVDDSRTVRASYTRLLREQGYLVETASNTDDAFKKAKRSQFDIAIVDYFMPGGNGDVLCQRLRDDPETNNITTAILTGTYLDEVIKDSLEAGAVECMFKNEVDELFVARLAAMSRSIRIKKSIETERHRLESILSSVGDGVYGVNADGQITFINPAGRKILGYQPDDALIGRMAYKMFHYADEEGRPITLDSSRLQQAYQTGRSLQGLDSIFWNKDGRPVPVECTVFPMRIDGHAEGSVIAFRDVSERKLLERELTWQANHDPLTKLNNRNAFERQLESEVTRLKRSSEKSALLYIDLDRFKYINDTAGHAAGDQLLVEIGQQLNSRLRESDLLARIGGDEFAIILRNIEEDDLQSASDSFREILEQYTFVYDGKSYKVNGSIGVALIHTNTQSPGEVLANADIACHIAKGRGRNQTHIYLAESDEKVAMNLELGWSNRLQEALQNDTFELYYQPIISLSDLPLKIEEMSRDQLWVHLTSNITTLQYEALVRFVDGPARQPISPNAFLPIAERFGLMPQIDNWVFTHVAQKLVQLYDDGINATFAINVSSQSLDSDNLTTHLKHLIDKYSIKGDSLILEITETSAIANIDAAKRLIHDLKDLGIRFALDDFGSGFSSFYHLKHLPVDFVKIDGQFVQSMNTSATDRAIVMSINDIAHSFGKKTIAEFVENATILNLLKKYGVDFVQGHYVAPPSAELPFLDLGKDESRSKESAAT